ncbi:MAG: VOC family protein [Rhodanobacter sp.]
MKPVNLSSGVLVNRSMPLGPVIPELAYANVREAADWLCRVFGFVERLRIGHHRVQLSFGEGSIIVVGLPEEASSAMDATNLRALMATQATMLRVMDVDKHYDQAKRLGARIINAPTDFPYGERQYSVEDVGGHRWTISQTIADVHPKNWGGILFE